MLRGEDYLDGDADAVPYTEARESEDLIRPDVEGFSDSKGKTVEEV